MRNSIAGVVGLGLLLAAAGVLGWHARRHLWPQATSTTLGQAPLMRYRVLAVMEFVRLVSMYGYMLGRWDRARDASFISNQRRYMGVASVDEIEPDGVQ